MKPLTEKQQALLDLLRAKGTELSYREMASKLHVGLSTISNMLAVLATRGYIRQFPYAARSIELVEPLEFRLRDFSNADLAGELRRRGYRGDIAAHSGAPA